MTVTLVRAVQTCMACPAQWDAWDADGNYYYLRYRCGHGEIRRYRTENWHDSDTDEYVETIASFEYGHPLDGSIGLTEFAHLAGVTLASGLAHTGFGDYLRDELILNGTFGPEILEEPEANV